MSKIKALGICNRGEVAVRIIRACQELGIRSVLLHSEADKNTRAYRLADETVCVGPSPVNESYLDIERNIKGAKKAKVDAIHPGFGFLSENAAFAQAVSEAGMIFVGPSPHAIESMGDKIKARALMIDSEVPVVPGYQGDDQSDDTLLEQAKQIGFPLIIKAAGGGGGRGLKVSQTPEDFQVQLDAARREGKSAFGSDKVFLEKYLDNAKHIEIQILGDQHGNVIHLYERECSIQRRHQKIVEEALSATLSPSLREKMADAAVRAAQAVDYTGAGTVEFLLDGENFYFLEMNTRLQVEHPVTEMVLGVDLVKAQIDVAEGKALSFKQEDLKPRGHAIECRLYAEDPYLNGIPSTGELLHQEWPDGPGRRFEYGFETGDIITEYYDSMIAKIIVYESTRDKCIEKTLKVLDDCVIFGVKTNLEYLKALLNHEKFKNGTMTTQFISRFFPSGLTGSDSDEDVETVRQAAEAQLPLFSRAQTENAQETSVFLGSWRNV